MAGEVERGILQVPHERRRALVPAPSLSPGSLRLEPPRHFLTEIALELSQSPWMLQNDVA